ncbi:TRAM domain-containing protein [Candidatus Woesearchaeota archaeon]|nr:TRAM domain-containing protein [Candidatus Woesearchaeota archaeon]
MYGQERRSFAPVKVGDEVDVKIEAVGEKGDGIAKVKGFVIFVPNTKQGDEVKVRITRVLKKVGFAEVAGQSSGNVEPSTQEEQSESEDESGTEAEEESSNEE